MRYLLFFLTFFALGCQKHLVVSQDKHPILHLKKVASYGQSHYRFDTGMPTAYKDFFIYFDGHQLRVLKSGNLLNYDYLDSPPLRSKPEYFTQEKALSVSENHGLYLIDLENFSSEYLLDLKKPVLCTPQFIQQDKIVIQYIDSTIDLYDLAEQKLLWHRTLPDLTKNYALADYSPLFFEGVIYCSVPGGMLVALDVETGKTLWTYSASNTSSSFYHDGADFLAPTSIYLDASSQSIVASYSDNALHVISMKTGLPKHITTMGSYNKTLKVQDRFIALLENNLLTVFEQDPKKPLWTMSLENFSLIESAIVGSSVYLLFTDQLWILSLDGEIEAQFSHSLIEPHLISNFEKDRIFLSDHNKYIYNLVS